MTIVSGFCAISVLIVIRDAKAKQKLKPAQYLSYKRGHIYRDFTFNCEACGTRISSAKERCPSCGDVFGENKALFISLWIFSHRNPGKGYRRIRLSELWCPLQRKHGFEGGRRGRKFKTDALWGIYVSAGFALLTIGFMALVAVGITYLIMNHK